MMLCNTCCIGSSKRSPAEVTCAIKCTARNGKACMPSIGNSVKETGLLYSNQNLIDDPYYHTGNRDRQMPREAGPATADKMPCHTCDVVQVGERKSAG